MLEKLKQFFGLAPKPSSEPSTTEMQPLSAEIDDDNGETIKQQPEPATIFVEDLTELEEKNLSVLVNMMVECTNHYNDVFEFYNNTAVQSRTGRRKITGTEAKITAAMMTIGLGGLVLSIIGVHQDFLHGGAFFGTMFGSGVCMMGGMCVVTRAVDEDNRHFDKVNKTNSSPYITKLSALHTSISALSEALHAKHPEFEIEFPEDEEDKLPTNAINIIAQQMLASENNNPQLELRLLLKILDRLIMYAEMNHVVSGFNAQTIEEIGSRLSGLIESNGGLFKAPRKVVVADSDPGPAPVLGAGVW